jgi:AraC-like DNA-binding protein
VSEVFHARIVDYGYPKHMHDTWTVLIVDDGAISYDLDKRHCGAFGQTVAILPPGVAHDGKPAPGAGAFTKRVLYLDPSFLPESLIGAAVDNTSIRDPDLRRALVAFHGELEYRPDPFDAETRLALIAERFSDHFSTDHFVSIDPERPIARGLREFLDAHATQPITLAAAALHFDRTKPHLVRSFTATYGLPPHAYLIGKRVEAARKLLLAGVPPSEAALTAGFYDQSHLTRHFKRHTSVPPATYAASNRFG